MNKFPVSYSTINIDIDNIRKPPNTKYNLVSYKIE